MKIQVFTIYDVQAERAIQPLFRDNDAIAQRDFEEAVTAVDNPFSKNPDDYVLYRIGEWDDENMYLEPYDPVRIISGMEAYKNRTARMGKIKDLHNQIDLIQSMENDSPGGTA